MRRRSAAAAAIVATPCFAANVVYHSSSTGYEDGRPGLDPDANTACETGLCVGGTRNGMSCSLDSDCPDIPDGIVEWPTGVVHLIDCRERSAGASQKSFSPIPANLTIDANPAEGLAVMQQILAPLVDDIPFDDPIFRGSRRSARRVQRWRARGRR